MVASQQDPSAGNEEKVNDVSEGVDGLKERTSNSVHYGSGSNSSTGTGSGSGSISPLCVFKAARIGDTESIQSAIMSGMDMNVKDEAGESPLMIASQHGHDEIVNWVTLAGARTEDVDRGLRTTPLMFACIGGHYKVVRQLLAAGANVDVRFDTDNNRVTPLMFTVQYCGIVRLRREEPWARFGATIQELIRGGADGENFGVVVSTHGILLSDLRINLKDQKQRSALSFAAELGHPEVTSWLLQAGAEVDVPDENGTRPLMFACRGGHAAAAGALLESDADPLSKTAKGSTPLHFAASAGSPQIMRQLLDRGSDIDAKTDDGDTPLSLAVSAGSVGGVGFLVKAGAALDSTDKEGRTCLDLAAVMFSLFPEPARQVVMQFLKDKGAQFRMIDDEMIESSHRIASELGVVKDEATGKFFVSAGEQKPKKGGTEEETVGETAKGAEKEDGSPEREQDREKSPPEGDAGGVVSGDTEDKV